MPDVLPNFSPWLAIAFAGGALLGRNPVVWVWPSLLVLSDLVWARSDIREVWSIYVVFAVVAFFGIQLRGKLSAFGVVGGTVLSAIAFYVISSSQAWLFSSVYDKSLAGWFQAITVGDPAFQPQAWVFAMRSVASEGLFALLLVIAYNGEAYWRHLKCLPLGKRSLATA
ncbi:MAG: hypothetical protein JNJ83_02410 [Verrucomicrobiaceae bacterium]|nr:hypothetical protein [Verrucomicrobiaceae bacterium]